MNVLVIFSEEAEEEHLKLVEESPHSRVARSIVRAIDTKKEWLRLDRAYGMRLQRNSSLKSIFKGTE